MPSGNHPEPPGGYDEGIVELQDIDGHPPNRGQATDMNTFFIPPEMILPCLGTRVK